MDYCAMSLFAKKYKLMLNRIAICNQLLGFGIDGCMDNPIRITYKRGLYSVTFDGDLLVSFRVWDVDSIVAAYKTLDVWSDCFWRVRRAGFLSPVV